ncbi:MULTISPECIES: DegT/DnrJ/EryC1/StrS aminotransferase family protein [unclassified Pseudoalteromonas]|uniref:DegT/DnrJ/EryC1/StrS family aminotransferase n=1 Tax=unclassified Pseudoalteromonas TaxID=194690 RepID=UPI0025B42CE5|nr:MULTISPECIES: DegT/DnrJ/EryC1/StrS aminotransferase family protein [unclassified Pseudoalteromonas]MDN3408121.1 DegT/DnrJ/EryC1/StrS aminotransferase family protein [Pseudoalteromonas sp. APC 3894]MDN3415761.1 DegT/DnrJ/EryC1/StrS aminotransferase family protein [Pseudoalteromonas sp. APC 3227]MDN3419459.1 DegT/DnrJ/EryC1/StrS aminotransferase family protein [Pseudoalteromonas sp. APC 3895]MDN3422828.1 DegT/DnrJ/EryC1/StrS aminotransferase family protein [Pseudoalteromonas sp. APC 3896]
MLNTPFSPWPSFTQQEADAVSRVVLSNKVNYWTGTEGREFEKEFATWADSEYAVALGNGTLALDIALKALGVGAGDEVITTPRTFLASASSIVTAGAAPVFADVDLNSQAITAESIKAVLTPKTKAVIVVHLAGMPAEMDDIMALSKEHGFYVIEDCAQAHGAKYRGRSVGSIGHIGAWSFCQDKIMTTGGEGGMVTTNSKELWSAMWSYKDHGKSFDAIYNREHPPGFRWLHESFGTNWRMTEMQAVIGRIQLTRMDDWTAKRQAYGALLDQAAKGFSCIRLVEVPDYTKHAEYKHYMFVKPQHLADGWSRDRIINEIVERGVPCFQGSCSEVYLEKAFDNTSWRPSKRLPNAVELGETSIMFLVHPTLTETEMAKTAQVMKEVFELASK